jgi:hypothetical protein
MPEPDQVNVQPIQDDDGNFGFRLQGAFLDLIGGVASSDALLTYQVEPTNPMFLITDAHLAGQPNLLGTTGSVSVTETFFPLGAAGEFTLDIYDDGGLGVKLVDWVDFDGGHRVLNVQKDILAASGDGSAVLSFVDQTFSQTPVPEPSTFALAALGLLGMCCRRKRIFPHRAQGDAGFFATTEFDRLNPKEK